MPQGREGQVWGAGKGEAGWDSEKRRERVGRRLWEKGQRTGRKEWRRGRGSRADMGFTAGARSATRGRAEKGALDDTCVGPEEG